ncbi:hypothetical protein [Sorangium sp. So ce1000]|uniref:hypothetical protein n=1 Tax=Sorangium sp. So ce1000 TaxID=3133325 RepID=UPI003F633C6F
MQQVMNRESRQLDGGQRDGYYYEYQIMLKDTKGTNYPLASVYATASTMGQAPPTIGGVPMAPATEYWLFNNQSVSKLTTCTNVDIRFVRSSNAPVSVGGAWVPYTATEDTAWTGVGAMTFPATAAVFGANQGIVRGVGFQTSSAGVKRVWWCQTSRRNLTPAELSSVQLLADAYGTSAGDYVASSQLALLQT